MESLYKPIPITKIQSWDRETKNNQGGTPNTYRHIYAHFTGDTANIRFDNPIQYVKGFRIESVLIETTVSDPNPVVYICSNTLSNCMNHNSVILPTAITNASGATAYGLARPNTLNCVCVLGANLQLASAGGALVSPMTYSATHQEFIPCRGTDIITLDLKLIGGDQAAISTSGNTLVCIGLTCEDHLRS